MTPLKSRSSAVALAACGLTAVLALSGCSAGQISQSASQQPAVNGTLTWVGDPTSGIALRNLHLRAAQTSDYVEPGSYRRTAVRGRQRVAREGRPAGVDYLPASEPCACRATFGCPHVEA